jgi:hypothetical protein
MNRKTLAACDARRGLQEVTHEHRRTTSFVWLRRVGCCCARRNRLQSAQAAVICIERRARAPQARGCARQSF